MTFRHLKIFITVADCSSMTEASKVLFIAQPTVSQAISELENHYKVRLFERLSRKLFITEDGKKLLNYARHIISLFDEMEQTMVEPEKTAVMRVGASITIGSELLPRLIKKYGKLHKHIKMNAVIKNTTEIEGLIVKNDIDFALVEGIVHNPVISAEAFMDDELVLVCGRDHPLFNRIITSIMELADYDFIVREQGSGTRELFESVMIANNASWRLGWECSSSDSIKSAAVNGVGIGVISKRLVKQELESGRLKPVIISGIDLRRKFNIIYHRNKYITENMKLFFDLCKKS